MKPSTVNELVDSLVQHLEKKPGEVAPIIDKLREHTRKGGLIDPQQEQTQFDSWFRIVGTLIEKRLLYQAAEVILALYDRLSQLQAKYDERYHKGAAAHQAALCYLMLGDLSSAYWFFTMAYIEDVLSEPQGRKSIPATPASRTLRVHFKQGESQLGAVAVTARKCKDTMNHLWHYPESVAVELARDRKLTPSPIRGASDIPLNKAFFSQLNSSLQRGDQSAKKKSLESLASYLAITLPGVRIIPNVRGPEHEMDLVVVQHTATPSYLLEALGRTFLVECKNWEKKVGVEPLNHFVAKMRFHRCNCGVIFAKNGLSGDKVPGRGLSYARLTLLRWYQQDECIVIVVKKEDLKKLADGIMPFSALLLHEYESVRFSISETEVK
jgi:hypothetical protein